MIGRRNFLRGAAVAPFAAKKVAENAAAQLSGVTSRGLLGAANSGYGLGNDVPSASVPSSDQWLKYIGDKVIRKELESIYYEREREVSKIDPDIAIHRSISLSAKIAYQRERNVGRAVNGLADSEGWWGRFNKFSNRIMGI